LKKQFETVFHMLESPYFRAMNFSSKLVEMAVDEFAKLPGVGRKTAFRFVVHLLKKDRDGLSGFANTLLRLKEETRQCKFCHNVTETEVCGICANPTRDRSLFMVVEDIRDMIAIESTGQFNGLYHLLGGVISPMDGIGPADITAAHLIERVRDERPSEIIMALRTTIEGDTTNFFLYKKLKDFPVKLTTIARGVAIGGELEYADEITLGRSILHRMEYEKTLSR
jgi:recombination protein RecR